MSYDQESIKQRYDEIYRNSDFAELLGEKQVTDAIINRLELERGDLVLDVPCGTGKYSRFLREHGVDVVGLDISEVGVRAADGEADSVGVADAMNLPVASDSVDLFFCHGFSPFNDPELANLDPFMNEVSRVLNADGRFVWGKTTSLKDEDVGSRYDHSLDTLRQYFGSIDGLEVESIHVTLPHICYFLRGLGLSRGVSVPLAAVARTFGLPTRTYCILRTDSS
ncbi:class I SAM-dependent methyltransferase [Halostagnicola sp. A-GB9-2]|uniref:class I SAM-dependent methyltransferase n=1 Tax=Halostagnicola sp. A-GB9-2 TaxID=3048066 RepID=UPI0024C0BC3C|nr:class I SAM-dependent methyltransferase [Halostagnicola sp. A-GB9-2]MDJ1434794.1 methyltransferase domain-containing protein [Halostagnicola sp. A-GB9-2]